ncbi:hypothetical protein RIR_jg28816.t1 [Rhizophagus irregularis DAOM 181602=DAOM 197198]|nr:hypothetical protein RIR_jg28816.t1 [Rhizophagus irregularis DAOM 181602=DAOM 197198]
MYIRDKVWKTVDATHIVLNRSREQVNSDTLEVNHTPKTHFVFDPYKIWNANENSQIPKDAWERHAEYILSIIQESTQLQVGWKGPGEAITLHLPNHNKPPRKNKKGEQNYSQNVPLSSKFAIAVLRLSHSVQKKTVVHPKRRLIFNAAIILGTHYFVMP